MTRTRPRLSVVPASAPKLTMDVANDPIAAEIYRETDIRLAAEVLLRSATRLSAIPRLPEVADYRAAEKQRFEAAVKIMREALGDER